MVDTCEDCISFSVSQSWENSMNGTLYKTHKKTFMHLIHNTFYEYHEGGKVNVIS